MADFKLKKHRVTRALFSENVEKEKKKVMEINVGGNILIPKDQKKDMQIIVKLRFRLGNEEERISLSLETMSVFEPSTIEEEEVSESMVEQKCLPIALTNLRNTVKMVTEAYGLSPLDLPPFDGEIIEE